MTDRRSLSQKRRKPEWTIDRLRAHCHIDERGCWNWTRATVGGYGTLRISRKSVRVHRLMFALVNGYEPPSTVDICHRCDNPPCCNPDHLFAGTRLDNVLDAKVKGRLKLPPSPPGDGCPNSKLTSTQVLTIRADVRSGRALARAYGVDRSTIQQIKHRRTWRHI